MVGFRATGEEFKLAVTPHQARARESYTLELGGRWGTTGAELPVSPAYLFGHTRLLKEGAPLACGE